MKVYATLECTW